MFETLNTELSGGILTHNIRKFDAPAGKLCTKYINTDSLSKMQTTVVGQSYDKLRERRCCLPEN